MLLKDILTTHADAFRSKTGVTDKLSLSDMTRLLDDLSWNKQNMLVGTSDQYLTLTGEAWVNASSAHGGVYNSNLDKLSTTINESHAGDHYTYAATITNLSDYPLRLVLYAYTGNKKVVTMLGPNIPAKSKDVKSYITITTVDGNNRLRANVEALTGKTPTISFKVKDERLYPGTEPGVWAPNPADKVGGS